MRSIAPREIVACIIGILIGGFFTHSILSGIHKHEDTHPIANPYDSDYHVHADFHVYIQDRKLDLSEDRFMTTNQQQLGKDAHLHDNNGEVKHIHAEDITFAYFINSLGLSLTEECLTEIDGTEHCAEDSTVLEMYVNGSKIDSITEYIPVDDDRILLHFGNDNNPEINKYLEEIPDDSCYYSGTCPERGIAPPESCGLTCEI